jgi:hypothetical protein
LKKSELLPNLQLKKNQLQPDLQLERNSIVSKLAKNEKKIPVPTPFGMALKTKSVTTRLVTR